MLHQYLLLTEWEVRTVIYEPSFLAFDKWKLKEKTRGSVTYSTDREDLVSKIFLNLSVFDGLGNDLCSCVTASNFLRTLKAKQVHLKSLLSR